MCDKKIRLLFVDDHNLFRKGLINLLDNVENMCVVGEASNGYEMIEQYRLLKPDVVVSDISMPELSGTDAADMILDIDKNAKILFLSMFNKKEDDVLMALNARGFGLIGKDISQEELVLAINTVYSGQRYFGPKYDDQKLDELLEKYRATQKKDDDIKGELTSRELEVLKYVSEGMNNKQIGEIMNLSHRTVESHKANLMEKLGVNSSTHLIRVAIEKGLLKK